MIVRVLDLDGSIPPQQELVRRWRPVRLPLGEWGPRVRLGCGFRRFRRFEEALARAPGLAVEDGPALTLYGSGDFHHVSLALVRRLRAPVNLLVIDNHPDWMRGVPFLHCGTWVYHAARLPQVRRVFHAGGDVDFDNPWGWLAPWGLLRSRRVVVFPGRRRFSGRRWSQVPHKPLRPEPGALVTGERMEELLAPWRAELAARPLYVSLDKDVLPATEAVVNWDSGHLTLPEVVTVLGGFRRAAGGRTAGADVVGDWSPVRVSGLPRHFLHLTEHPRLTVDPARAAARNETTNLSLLDALRAE